MPKPDQREGGKTLINQWWKQGLFTKVFYFTTMPPWSFCKPVKATAVHDEGGQCLQTDALQTWLVLSFFMGLAHSFPERICQICQILTLNFWLNNKKVQQCGYDSSGHSSRGTGVTPSLGWSRNLRLHRCFSLDFLDTGELTWWKSFIIIRLPPSHAKAHLLPSFLCHLPWWRSASQVQLWDRFAVPAPGYMQNFSSSVYRAYLFFIPLILIGVFLWEKHKVLP